MSSCTFFGHRDCPASIKSSIRSEIISLIENQNADRFYVGNHGCFDAHVLSVLKELSNLYPHIQYAVVLNRMPDTQLFHASILPEGIELVHPRFSISWRNRWMIDHSDFVVAYITRSFGGAYQFTELAKRKQKKVIYIK
ncbi:MAG: hypothetical protein IJB25_12940 [Clostridia bacterium]|nr:hypothetical protein [Clostridia bacterium]MBQ4620761.1 hypothetical protein [Clostridia bacterium]MBQ9857185.1 hypothetical protein [Clostridia bacterium]